MRQTSTQRTELRKLEANLHQAKQTAEVRLLIELVEMYRAEAIAAVIHRDKDREIEVGTVRAYERILGALKDGPVTAEQFIKTGA